MPNTLIPYMYRDHDNYKAHAEAIFAGAITDAERAALIDALEQTEFNVGLDFKPNAVGLEDAREVDTRWTGEWDDEVDHSLNELLHEDITLTDREPTDERTISEFVFAIETTKD